jgi:hypothetical protein
MIVESKKKEKHCGKKAHPAGFQLSPTTSVGLGLGLLEAIGTIS